ncbi:unnamed protein product [marine sediment metagenome]|uniref:Uncharacterized protein n=1 Tax=marine sediment metagenome TaxID=412755 RepID=X1TTA7_9ZZZZ
MGGNMKVCKIFVVVVNVDGVDTEKVNVITEFLNELREVISVTQSMVKVVKSACGYLIITIIGEK